MTPAEFLSILDWAFANGYRAKDVKKSFISILSLEGDSTLWFEAGDLPEFRNFASRWHNWIMNTTR